jgi:cysteine synthase A
MMIDSRDVTDRPAGNPVSVHRRDWVEHVAPMVGNTPLLAIHYQFDGESGVVFAKYELENMTGSIKDRMALHILRQAYQSGAIETGAKIVEASSGNTGISFASIGRALGHDVLIFIPDWMSQERISLIRSFGAEVVLVSHEEGGFVGAVQRAEAFARDHREAPVFLPRQFDNRANIEAHVQSTAPEIESQLGRFGRSMDAFVAGVGTGGTVMGIDHYFRGRNPGITIHPLEPANSPTLRTSHHVGEHRIQGISDEFVPSILDLAGLDSLVDVWDGDAILMAQKMCSRLGLAVGISSGANILGAVMIARELGPEATVVTVLPDSNKKYLSTDLFHCEPVKEHYLTPRISLVGFESAR